VQVATITLSALIKRFDISHIDFLKIDVEGHEAAIVNSTDWSDIHPRVLVIEANAPNSRTARHGSWETTLVAAGFRCALFDGLNRFYARKDDHEAQAMLAVPANVLDGFEPWRWVSELNEARRYIGALEGARATAEAYAKELEGARDAAEAYARELERVRGDATEGQAQELGA
jgi:hypothetical protein